MFEERWFLMGPRGSFQRQVCLHCNKRRHRNEISSCFMILAIVISGLCSQGRAPFVSQIPSDAALNVPPTDRPPGIKRWPSEYIEYSEIIQVGRGAPVVSTKHCLFVLL